MATSTTRVENALVRPGVTEGVARGTSGSRMTGMGMGQGATMPLSKSAVKVDLTAVLEMTRGAQET